MRTKTKALVIISVSFSVLAESAFAQGTSFTYQGRLLDHGSPPTGSYDLTFALRDALTGGTQVGGSQTNFGASVSNGLFTVSLNFGTSPFDGSARWLEIGVRSNGTSGAFSVLSPRQALTATPYALFSAGSPATVNNQATGLYATVAGGLTNQATGPYSTVGGGRLNLANQYAAVVAGGQNNFATNTYATVGGGDFNSAAGASATVAGGMQNNASGNTATVGGGYFDIASGAYSTVGGGYNNTASGDCSTVGGGHQNTANNTNSVVAGGVANYAAGIDSTVAGGSFNYASAAESAIGGGFYNYLFGPYAVIAGGVSNYVTGNSAAISGGLQNRALNQYASVGGGYSNVVNSYGGTIAGGQQNTVFDQVATIGGGIRNKAAGSGATVAGGVDNTASNVWSTVGGGFDNTADGVWSTVAGGEANRASGTNTTVGGGVGNRANGNSSTVPGGQGNSALADYSFAAGLNANALHPGTFAWADSTGAYFNSTAANQFLVRAAGGVGINNNAPAAALDILPAVETQGVRAVGNRTGYWNNSIGYFENANASLNAAPALRAVANGNAPDGALSVSTQGTGLIAKFGNNSAFVSYLDTAGNWSAVSFNGTSDRNAKENFKPVDARDVLRKVASLPISTWDFKQDSAIRHVGPMAQDFYSAFGLGPDDKHISTVDAEGVALASIQALNQIINEQREQLRESETEIQQLKTHNSELEKRLKKIEQALSRTDSAAP